MYLPNWPNPNYFHHINLGLERILELLKRLDNPHLRLPPTIHIAGTNGKGSTLSFLKNIYEDAGYKVHRYTSPHLVEFNERIELAGQKITDDFLQEILTQVKEACELSPTIDITFFEATTAGAFLAFSKIPADILLLETGMGGEFDATNVLPNIFQAIITPISFDHQEFLGNSLKKIAKAKAGIIKENCLVISSKQELEALEVIKNTASIRNARLIESQDFCKNLDFDFSNLNIPLRGAHQVENCQTAITAIKNQNLFKIDNKNIVTGISKTKWRARLEKITSGNFYQKLSANFDLYLDGSHNIQGASTIKEFLESVNYDKVIMIFQMLCDKNCEDFLRIISQSNKIHKLFSFDLANNSKFRGAQDIFAICAKQKINCEIAFNFNDCFDKILSQYYGNKALILICGSLYFAGEFLKENI